MSNIYCGPFAVSYALGISVKEAAARIRELNGKRSVRGVGMWWLHLALRDHCKRVLAWPSGPAAWPTMREPSEYNAQPAGERQPTVLEFAALFGAPDRCYVLVIPRHFMVLDGARIYDNNGTALVSDHHKNGRHVVLAWHVSRPGNG